MMVEWSVIMLRQQRWHPDTCGCVFLEIWDDSTDPVQRTHNFYECETDCERHENLSDSNSKYNAAILDNKMKNTVLLLATVFDSNISHENYKWKFNDEGVLIVNFGKQVDSFIFGVQAAADIQFGKGKVLVS